MNTKPLIELCKHYTTAGHPYFRPKCLKGHRASLRCHIFNWQCFDYRPSSMPYGFKKKEE